LCISRVTLSLVSASFCLGPQINTLTEKERLSALASGSNHVRPFMAAIGDTRDTETLLRDLEHDFEAHKIKNLMKSASGRAILARLYEEFEKALLPILVIACAVCMRKRVSVLSRVRAHRRVTDIVCVCRSRASCAECSIREADDYDEFAFRTCHHCSTCFECDVLGSHSCMNEFAYGYACGCFGRFCGRIGRRSYGIPHTLHTNHPKLMR
jgi:hypothetical protein